MMLDWIKEWCNGQNGPLYVKPEWRYDALAVWVLRQSRSLEVGEFVLPVEAVEDGKVRLRRNPDEAKPANWRWT